MSVKRSKLLTGSLRDPIFRYAISASIVYNPYIRSVNAKHFYDRFIQLASKYDRKKIQDIYVWDFKVVEERDLTIKNHCSVTFLDETKTEFDFTNQDWNSFVWHLKWTNEAIYNKRAMDDNNDDDFDDEI